MLKVPISEASGGKQRYMVLQKPWMRYGGAVSVGVGVGKCPFGKQKRERRGNNNKGRIRCSSESSLDTVILNEEDNTKSVRVKATLTVLKSAEGYFSEFGVDRGIDDIKELLGKSLQLFLASARLDPRKSLLLNHYNN